MLLANQIRVLDVLPDGGDAKTVYCNARAIFLGRGEVYDTLSYVWKYQSTGEAAAIIVDGIERKVTLSLHQALRRLRSSHNIRTLWVNQLCINQDDLEEKGAQVRLMRETYTQCAKCHVWMGELPTDIVKEDMLGAFQIIEYLSRVSFIDREQVMTLHISFGEGVSLAAEDHADDLLRPPAMKSADAFRGPMNALKHVSPDTHPWWHRAWTIQEATLPLMLELVKGDMVLPWERLRQARTGMVTGCPKALSALLSPNDMDVLNTLFAHVTWISETKRIPDRHPLDILVEWRIREASVPHDNVYALLGLLPGGSLPSVERCDYAIDEHSVYAATTIGLILAGGGLRPLIADPRLHQLRSDSANWALNMSTIPQNCERFYPLHSYFSYDAANGRPLNTENLRLATGQLQDTLPLTGTGVAKVQRIIGPHFAQKLDTTDEELIRTLQLWAAGAGVDIRAPTWVNRTHPCRDSQVYESFASDKQMDSFARTVIGDLVRHTGDTVVRRATVGDAYQAMEIVRGEHPGTRYQCHGTMWRMVKDAVFFLTDTGAMGLGHRDTLVDDEVWILNGGRVPFTLRPRPELSSEDFDFVGRCYVHGIMFGEFFQGPEPWQPETVVHLH